MPGIDLPSGIKPLNPVPVDFWSGPYNGVSIGSAKTLANATITPSIRFITMEVRLIVAGIGYKYWYKAGINDVDLIPFEAVPYTPDFKGSSSGTALINPGTTILSLGDSFTEGYTASNPATKGYVPILSNHLNTIGQQFAVGGSGALNAVKQLFQNIPNINNEKNITYLSGFNDIKKAGDNVKTYEKLKGCLKSVIANTFIKTVNTAISQTYTGWVSSTEVIAVSKSSLQFSQVPIQSSTVGNSFTYNFTGNNLVIGTFGVDNVGIKGGIITIVVDGLSNLTYTFDNRNLTDGIIDFQSFSNIITPNVVYLSGLGTGIHTVVITTTTLETGGKVFLDYVGTLNNPQSCKPVLVGAIPKILNWAKIEYSPYNNGSDIIADKADVKYQEAINVFPTYPVYWVSTNSFFNKLTDINVDEVHPNDKGYSHIADAFESVVIPYSASTTIGVLPVLQGGTGTTSVGGIQTLLGLGTAAYNNTGDFYASTNPANYINRTGISATGSLSYNNTTGIINYIAPTLLSQFTNDLTNIPNSALTNSSISFATGTTGTSPNWTASPVSLGSTATINIPLAGVGVTSGTISNTTQTLIGDKTFSNNIIANSFIKTGGISSEFLKADGGVGSINGTSSQIAYFNGANSLISSSNYTVGETVINSISAPTITIDGGSNTGRLNIGNDINLNAYNSGETKIHSIFISQGILQVGGTIYGGANSGQLSFLAGFFNIGSFGNSHNIRLQAPSVTIENDLTVGRRQYFTGVTSGVIGIIPQFAAGTWNFNLPITAGTAGQVLTSQGGGSTAMTWETVSGGGGGGVTNVSGTTNRITVATGTTTPVVDISSAYIGQTSITTLGTIATGTWNGTVISDTYISSASNWNTAFSQTRQWNGGATGLVAATGRTSLGLIIGTDVLAQRTFGSAANNNTGDFYLSTNPSGYITSSVLSSYLPLAGGTLTGDLTIDKINPYINFNRISKTSGDSWVVYKAGGTNQFLLGTPSWSNSGKTFGLFNQGLSAWVWKTEDDNLDVNFAGGIIATTGTFNSSVTATSQTINGTAGAGFLQLNTQSSAPSTPTTNNIRLFSDAIGRLSWKGSNGYVRTFDGTSNTADRIYVLPDLAGTVALTANNLSVFAPTTSAQFLGVVSDETGTGLIMGNNTPTILTPTIAAINGGTGSNDDITIQGTTNATRTTSYVNLQPNGGFVGIGTSTPTGELEISGNNVDGVGAKISNNGATGSSPNFIMYQGGSNAYGVTAWQNAAIFEAQSTGGLAFGAFAGDIKFYANTSRTTSFIIKSTTGNVGLGTLTPTAYLHTKAGTASANTAPLKFTAGTLLTTPEAFTQEADASNFYQTNNALNRYTLGGAIKDFFATVDNVGTAESDLYTYTTKASTLAANGGKLMFKVAGTFNDATSTAQLQFYFGGVNIGNTGTLTVSAVGGWNAEVMIIRTSSTTARVIVTVNTPGASTALYTTQTDLTGLTLSATNIIKVTGTAGGATGGSGDISAKIGAITFVGAANN